MNTKDKSNVEKLAWNFSRMINDLNIIQDCPYEGFMYDLIGCRMDLDNILVEVPNNITNIYEKRNNKWFDEHIIKNQDKEIVDSVIRSIGFHKASLKQSVELTLKDSSISDGLREALNVYMKTWFPCLEELLNEFKRLVKKHGKWWT